MDKRSHIRAIGEQPSATVTVATQEGLSSPPLEGVGGTAADQPWDYVEPKKRRQILPVLLPVFAVILILFWTGFFVWVNRAAMMLAPTSPAQWIDWISKWAVPVLLVIAIWLLALRSSAREAKRFGNVAQTLAHESAALEDRLTSVNRELSLAREFLTTQARELDFLGRSASERISEHAGALQSLISDNGRQVDAIAGVSVSALENMTKLRENLPVVANAARDVSNQIGGAGRLAQNHLAELVSGFERLNEFGAASERQVAGLRSRVDDAIAAFTEQAAHLETVAAARFAALRESSERFGDELDARETEALTSIRTRAEALRIELAEVQARTNDTHRDAADSIAARLAALRDEAARVSGEIRQGEGDALAAWNTHVGELQNRLLTALEEVAALDEKALANANEKLRALSDEAEHVDARLTERNAEFDREMEARRARINADEADASQQLARRLAAIDEAISRRREEQVAQLSALTAEGEALATRIGALGTTFADVSAQGREAQARLAEGVAALSEQLTGTRDALTGTDMAVVALTDASVRLLELIQASAKHSRSDLPEAMAAAETRLEQMGEKAFAIRATLDETVAAGDHLGSTVESIGERGRASLAAIEEFQSRLATLADKQAMKIGSLRTQMAGFGDESDALARKLQEDLHAALDALENNARSAVDALQSQHRAMLAGSIETLGADSVAALQAAIARDTATAVEQLEMAANRAAEASREATVQLRDQLVKVGELATNLEARVHAARERAEEQVDNDFSRRVALITESLNSNSIDIAKALSTEVTDTAWASYLRGDRGVFTRRAVRLLENSEARSIAELYDGDHEFREHVSRYIHDFEAMLRTVLSTRDGHAVGVTLLSGDMGKLYVSLAQALERLRQ